MSGTSLAPASARQRRGAHRARRPQTAAPAEHLPQPPTDAERVLYFGPQRRWVFFVLFGSFCGVIYGMYRMSLQSTASLLLWAPVAGLFGYALVSMISSSRRRRSSLTEHEAVIAGWLPGPGDTVDVYLPSCGEPMAVLENTYYHVSQLDWPADRITVWVGDDSDRPEVRQAAARYGFQYTVRRKPGHMKKAGNLAHLFSLSKGRWKLILDADFAPRPSMLREMVPYFQRYPNLGIVQTPQFFDVSADFNWVQRASASVQELFYRWIQPSRDAVNGAICVGTNAMYARDALLAAGGYAQIGHSEDVHTGVKMLKAGFLTRYVPINLAKGVCPDTLDGYCNMVYRWCVGSMSLLGNASFHRAPLGRRQRACFWTGFLYYISSGLLVVVGPVPGLLMIWVFSDDVRPSNFTPLIPSILVSWAFLPLMTGGRWKPEIIRLTYLTGYCHLLAVWDSLRERVSAWVPTGAAKKTPLVRRVNLGLMTWGLGTQLALWAGIVRGVATYGIGAWWATLLYSAVTTAVLLPLFTRRKGIRPAAERVDPVVLEAEALAAAAR